MFESGLDAINESNNTVVSYMNSRVDQIMQTVHETMHDHQMMEFVMMAVGMPLLGLGMFVLGAPLSVIAPLAVVAPMSLLGHMSHESSAHTSPEHQHLEFNFTVK